MYNLQLPPGLHGHHSRHGLGGHGDHGGHVGHIGHGGRGEHVDQGGHDRTGQDRTGQNCHLNLTFQVTWDWQRDKFAMFLAKSFKICLVQDYKKNTFCLGEAG